MSNSSLATIKIPAYTGNYTKGRSGKKINKIAIHHMGGKSTAKQCGAVFQNPTRRASSHYGIGNDGEIALYVDEANTAWTNGNWNSNCESVTIETSNRVAGGQWPVSDNALNSLIKLVADIAKRNNITLVKGVTVVWHSMYQATACPGPYLLSKIDYIIQEANKINNATPTQSTTITNSNYLANTSYTGSSIVSALNQIGVDSSYNYRAKLAFANGIKNYSGTASQNIQMLNLLKQGRLLKVGATSTPVYNNYYPVPNYNGSSIVEALNKIGVNSSYSNRAKIASKNGISGYAGTASQNTKMLNLLKQGKLVKI